MAEVGHMNFFKVERCGLYGFKGVRNKTYGCELEETMDLLAKWVKDRNLAETIPWDPTSTNTNKSKCYCKDIYKDKTTGDYLLVLWKSDTDNAGTLLGASEDGSGQVFKYTSGFKKKKVIWGRPCYYWIIPSLNTIVSIKFDHSVCDAELFKDYLVSAVNNRVKHKNKVRENTEGGFVRLSFMGDDETRYYYSFSMKLMSLNTEGQELTKLASRVTHIVRRETVNVASKDEREEWVKLLSEIKFLKAKPKAKKRKIEVSFEAKPTAKELSDIIEKFSKEDRKKSEWENVGFKREDGNITWVDRYRLKENLYIMSRTEDVFNAKNLLEHIHKQRARFLKPINDHYSYYEKLHSYASSK